jgi:hypothetical protein
VASALDPATSSRGRALVVALVATLLALGAQWALVRCAYAGNWTALFYSGESYGVPAELAAEGVHLFPGTGYDGQIYHAIAHDPLLRHGASTGVDAPRLRYRRILVPLLAWLGAGGGGAAIDRAYRAVVLAFVFLGVFWCARAAEAAGRAPAWGALFVLLPASVVSLERMTVDVALAALTAGWALAVSRGSRLGWLALAAAPLVRETGLILVAAAVLAALSERRVRPAVVAAACALPACAWFAYVQARTPASDYPNSFVPLGGIVNALLHPAAYGSGVPAAVKTALDAAALVGIVLAFVLAAWWLKSAPRSPRAWGAALFALTGVFVQRPDNWAHVYDYGRVYSPLLLLLAMDALSRRDARRAAPWLLMEPRLLWQLTGPAAAALRGLLG